MCKFGTSAICKELRNSIINFENDLLTAYLIGRLLFYRFIVHFNPFAAAKC